MRPQQSPSTHILVWVTYSVSSTNYLGVPNSAQWTYNWNSLSLHNLAILCFKALICINYNYSVWVYIKIDLTCKSVVSKQLVTNYVWKNWGHSHCSPAVIRHLRRIQIALQELLYAVCGVRLKNFDSSNLLCICPFILETNLSKGKYYLVSCNDALGKNTLPDRRHSVGTLINIIAEAPLLYFIHCQPSCTVHSLVIIMNIYICGLWVIRPFNFQFKIKIWKSMSIFDFPFFSSCIRDKHVS